MDLVSKIAIVTGASRGSGAAFSTALIEKGSIVYGIARNIQPMHKLQQQLGKHFVPVVLDVSDQTAVKTWIENTFSENHSPDILINNAGAGYFGKIDELPTEQWLQMINTNLNAVFYLTSAVVPLMKKSKTSSHIINIGSILGKVSGSEKSGYSATKFGVQGFSDALFKELRGDNIKVSCINPGSIDTPFFETSGIVSNEKMLQPKALADILIQVLETPDNVLIDELTVRPLNTH